LVLAFALGIIELRPCFARSKNILDGLIARKRIAPIIGVFVPPIDRNSEYAGAEMNLFYSIILSK
jgi:enterochelin esterase-like enzyme